jgi:hypothetical protein
VFQTQISDFSALFVSPLGPYLQIEKGGEVKRKETLTEQKVAEERDGERGTKREYRSGRRHLMK